MSNLLSVGEVSAILKVSRQSVFKKIKNKKMKAMKVGRNYVIPKDEVLKALGLIISEDSKREIDKAVEKAMTEYREAFQKLGKE